MGKSDASFGSTRIGQQLPAMPLHGDGSRLTRGPSLKDQLVERLSQQILSGQLGAGARLPTEHALMAAFGVSRTVVREAVAVLKAEGLVITRQGSGAFVTADVQRRPFRIDPDALVSLTDVLQVMELRTSVEVEAAALAAGARTIGDLAAIDAALEALEAAIARGELAADADFEFHHAIAAATGNPYFAQFLEFLGRFIIPRLSVRTAVATPAQQGAYLALIQAEHRAIAAAIHAGDAAVARDAMRRHLAGSRARYRKLADEIAQTRRDRDA